MSPVSRNVSKVKAPQWTADDAVAYPIIVSRGEPRRTDEQMYDAVREQVNGYFAALGTPLTEGTLDLVTASIALDHIHRTGAQAVMLTREHVRAYLTLVMKDAA